MVEVVDGVDPVTRRPTEVEEVVRTGVALRVVHRDDRSVVRDPNQPSRVIVDHDALHDPDLVLGPRHRLILADGRTMHVAGETAELGRLQGEAIYHRTPLVQVGRRVRT